MGTRSAAKIKLRTAPYRCDICGRRLMSAESLRTHQLCLHNIANKFKTKAAPTKQGVTKPKSLPQTQKTKNLKVDNNGVKQKNTSTKKIDVNSKPSNKVPEKSMGKRGTKPIETCNEYECPKCLKTFPIYFLAHRHIQKSHCVNSLDEKVSPNSPNLIKPNIMLVCVKCNKRPKSLETHKCTTLKLEEDDKVPSPPFYICMGCNQRFQSLRLFDLHVSGLHCDGVESMFFPTSEVFHSWKEDVIKQTGVKYYILGNYNYKQMHRCPCLPEENSTDVEDITPFLCPSCIVVQELPKGIQVHIYKHHYGHNCGTYVLPDKYKKYTLSTLIQNEEAYTKINDDLKITESDMYQQFKQLMECIVVDAAKISIDSLKILISKALDMTSVLNNYEDDPESHFVSMKNILENNVTEKLGQLDNQSAKKRIGSNDDTKTEPITKRFKTRTYQNKDGSKVTTNLLEDSSIKIVNSFSLAEHEISNAINEEGIEKDLDNQDETGKVTPSENNTTDSQASSDKEKDDAPDIKVKKKQLDQSPSSFAESYKDFVKQLSGHTQTKKKSKIKPNWSSNKRQVTKSVSPKPQNIDKESKTIKPTTVETSPAEVKHKISNVLRPVDYKYEVKEQENDCNILILKI